MTDPMVSIYVPTYNHENYIVQALDSILMQRTEYSYEVLVGEDCSTDNTRQVLKAWEQAHPGKFTIFYREQNMHKSACPNARDLKLRCKGKYIICLEGDDFWTDPLKLQKQVSFLEAHPEYYAVAHNCVVVDRDGQPNGEQYPECKDGEYTLRHYASDILPGQYTTLLTRNYMKDETFDGSLIAKRTGGPGDRKVYFSILCHGRIFCMQEVMSAYRHVTAGGSSFSANHSYRYEAEERFSRGMLEYAYHLGNPEAVKCAELLYLCTVRYALRKRLTGASALADLKRIKHKCRAFALLLKRDINYRVLHKTPYV